VPTSWATFGAINVSSGYYPPSAGPAPNTSGKKLLTDKPAEDGMLDFGDMYKAEDRSGLKGGFDLIYALVCRSRAKFARDASLTEQ